MGVRKSDRKGERTGLLDYKSSQLDAMFSSVVAKGRVWVRVQSTSVVHFQWSRLARDHFRILRPVYTCDFWCDFWCAFAYKTRLTLPCTNVFFAKHHVDWKERYDILFEYTLLSYSCQLDGISSHCYATKNPCGVGWGRFCTQNRIEIAWKIACVNGPSHYLLTYISMTCLRRPRAVDTIKKYRREVCKY